MTKLTHSYSSMKMFENCPKRYYHQRIAKEVTDPGGEASIYGNRIHEQLEHRLKGEAVLPAESVKYEPICLSLAGMKGELLAEQKLTLNKNLQPTGWWDDDAWMRSILDVIIRKGDTAIVADWKTGKHRPDFFQLELFALQTFQHYPEVQRVKSTFIWLKDMRIDHEVYLRDGAPALWDKLQSKVCRIEQAMEANAWPAKPSGLCPWCPAKHLCEFSR